MIRLAIRCRADQAEGVLAELLELAPNGVEEESGQGWVEFAVYGAPGELPSVPDVEAAAGAGLVAISSTEIPDDWGDRWRDFHRPIPVAGGRVVVRPSWEPAPAEEPASDRAAPGREAEEAARIYSEEAARIDVVVDPGQAFGTGAHATTSMCLELLVDASDAGLAGGPLADLGTGSGVLAICAAKLGWGPVTAYDHEPAALEAAEANAAANGVDLELRRVNLRQELPPLHGAAVANLTAPLLLEVASRLRPPLPRPLICSGLLSAEADRVAAAFRSAGMPAGTTREAGDWAAISFPLA